MTLFAIIRQPGPGPQDLGLVVLQHYPEAYDLGNGAWLISDDATAQSVSAKLGITEGQSGSAVVLEVASYYGRANPAIWSWMKAKWESAPSG